MYMLSKIGKMLYKDAGPWKPKGRLSYNVLTGAIVRVPLTSEGACGYKLSIGYLCLYELKKMKFEE